MVPSPPRPRSVLAGLLLALGCALALPVTSPSAEVCPEVCQANADCPEGEICFPPDQQCRPPCAVSCLVPDPVCGDDGVTYPCGEIDAHCYGAEVVSEGPCEQDCVCPDVWAPVCGENGITYPNACEAACADVGVSHDGTCGQPPCGENADCPEGKICFPPDQQCRPPCGVSCLAPDPVCGDDGATYPCGEIDAHCHGAEVAFEGPCEEPCVCPNVYAPVCGDDGETYGNACLAQCAGTDVAAPGECPPIAECQANADCPEGEICFPPDQQCRPPCGVSCLVPDPVCGDDGATYPCGEIDAHCHGAVVAHPGPCQGCAGDAECPVGQTCQDGQCGPCVCPQVYVPVCGENGQTFANACFATCAHVDVAFQGACEDGCASDADCPVDDVCSENECVDCECPALFDPVCGADGKTYGNACEARCAHVGVAFEGECGVACRDDADCPIDDVCQEAVCTDCVCPLVFDPVCGTDGVTYENACFARCAHAGVVADGECSDDCRADAECPINEFCSEGRCTDCECPAVFDPVCGTDGKTYGNACEARCAHVPVRHEGECGSRCRSDAHCPTGAVCQAGECAPCTCPDVYDPVCGADGETHGNACLARCAHAAVEYDGECIPPGCFEDTDLDGVSDAEDNCIETPNGPSGGPNVQTDSDGDDYGNVCDCDFNQDGFCNIDDFLVFLPDFGAGSDAGAGTDMTGDGFVNIDDFVYFLPGFLAGLPGPSAFAP